VLFTYRTAFRSAARTFLTRLFGASTKKRRSMLYIGAHKNSVAMLTFAAFKPAHLQANGEGFMPDQSKELLTELKSLWGISSNEGDHQALSLIDKYLSGGTADQEAFEIQQKVLAKTRAKTESLLKRLDDIESKL